MPSNCNCSANNTSRLWKCQTIQHVNAVLELIDALEMRLMSDEAAISGLAAPIPSLYPVSQYTADAALALFNYILSKNGHTLFISGFNNNILVAPVDANTDAIHFGAYQYICSTGTKLPLLVKKSQPECTPENSCNTLTDLSAPGLHGDPSVGTSYFVPQNSNGDAQGSESTVSQYLEALSSLRNNYVDIKSFLEAE